MWQNNSPWGWARTTIRSSGLRATSSRISTLLVLRDSAKPLTHAEVFEQLASKEVDKATVFRNLVDMVANKLLRRLELGDRIWRFELILEKDERLLSHPHFVCNVCRTVSCLDQVKFSNLIKQSSPLIGDVTDVVLRGRCQDCK